MTASRFIHNLEATIKDKERYSSNLRLVKIILFKAKVSGMSSRLSEYIPEQAVLNFNKIKVCGRVCISKIVIMY